MKKFENSMLLLFKLIARKKLKAFLAIFFILLVFTLTFIVGNYELTRRFQEFTGSLKNENTYCYDGRSTNESVNMFSTKNEFNKTTGSKNIFFFQTNCFGTDGIVITSRQFCAIESAALMNPNMSVYLLLLSPLNFSNDTEHIVRLLLSNYKNIAIKHISTDNYFKDTPLEDWWKSGIFRTSYWPVSHMSDVLRFLTLWKFPGIYLDLDIVVKSSLEDLIDFVGAEDAIHANAAVFSLGMTEIGRKIADMCIEDLINNFRGNDWGNNGPGVITRTLQKICGTKNVVDMTTSNCQGFTVYPPSHFFPIPWRKWKLYFDAEEKNQTMNKIKNSRTIHLWNKHSKSTPVDVGSDVPYGIIANNYCPLSYNNNKIF